MEKITTFMRATKKRKALETDVIKPSLTIEKKAKAHVAPANPTTLKKPKTVPETDDDDELYENGIHVPKFIYATVKYTRKTVPHKVDEATQRVVDYIQDHFDVPLDFETSSRFGPHSGLTYESRLLRAYKLQLLPAKTTETADVAPICLTCTTVGHADRDCPDGF